MQCEMHWELLEHPIGPRGFASATLGEEQIHDRNIWGKECHLSLKLLCQPLALGLWGPHQGERTLFNHIMIFIFIPQ